MKKYDKEIIQLQLDHEKKVIKELEEMYKEAEKQIDEKIQLLMTDELTQSKIYQVEYQKALKGQIGTILDNMNSNNYDSIQNYLKKSYEDGYIGTMYSLQKQGIPLVMPINQDAVVKAIQLDSKLSGTLYEALGINTNDLKKTIRNEISRGISNGYSYKDMSRNISKRMGVDLNKSIRIARTEGHRVNQQSTMDGILDAKDKGADVVKQWDSTLDANTRPSHQMVDGEIKELDEKFSNGLRFPGDPQGKAAEVINCRCVLLQRARWALDDEELETLQNRAEYYGLDKTKNFDEFREKYYNYDDWEKEQNKFCKKYNITDEERKAINDYTSSKSYLINDQLRNNYPLNKEYESFKINLKSALDKMPNYKGTVTRSVYFNDPNALQKFLKDYVPGREIDYKEFLSTTRGETYNPDAQVQMTIVDAIKGKDISLFNFKEKKVLYNTDSRFEVKDITDENGTYFIKLAERK